ncbi:MAG: sensor histidine kinase KdpD [Myxococcota bacterium]|nr:sensor histidine kinase KdpD [Myxococcota bacterium]
MDDPRPDPDQLLLRVVEVERRARRGQLTIYFGAAPGVGKTYAMLEAARAEMEKEKRDVVVGVVETHGRYETGALLLGLELLPRKKLAYRGVSVEEFDLDAALARKPELVLVDELAHTNAEGSRHPKRFQDVEELLDAGIDVFSTMNVQHVESLNDVIAKITGVVVRETVPDSVLERAHELKLVDLPPDDLLERLRDGKVYVPAQAQRAIENFFRKGNLIALRELALRKTAERVDAQMRAFRAAQGIEQTWAATERILVGVSPSPFSARLIRAARRMAGALHARWYAVFVEPPGPRALSKKARDRLSKNLSLAEQLGAEVVTLSGESTTDELLRFARERNITKIIVGKPLVHRFVDRLRQSFVDRLIRGGGDIDVYVTAGDPEPDASAPEFRTLTRIEVPSYVVAALSSAVSTGLAFLLFGRDQLPDVVMTYLLGIVLVASRYGIGPSIASAVFGVAAFDYFFVSPYLNFRVSDLRHAVTFVVMFLVAVVISSLTQRVKAQATAARHREQRTRALYELSKELAAAHGPRRVAEIAAAQVESVFRAQVQVFRPDATRRLARIYASPGAGEPTERDSSVSQWVYSNQREAGLGTATLPSGPTLYQPLLASGGVVGVLGLTPEDPERLVSIEQRRQVDAFAAQMALALERADLAEQTDRTRQEMEREQLRSALLSSVSHDLRTPLAVITGAASTLVESRKKLDENTELDLSRTILEEAERLNRLIRNLLDMTRLESGAVRIDKEWLSLEEVVGAALNRLESRLGERSVRADLPADLPLVPFDAVLVEQAFINLLENAIKYSDGPIEIDAASSPAEITVTIADRGPGIPPGEEQRVFEKFHRAVSDRGGPSGAGLGLTICRAIVAAHGGRIWVRNREGGGAAFRFTLPLEVRPPTLEEPAAT